MDLLLASSHGGFRLKPQSALGMVWLLTHFDVAVWSLLATGWVLVCPSSADRLCQDALSAGLQVNRIPNLSLPLSDPS